MRISPFALSLSLAFLAACGSKTESPSAPDETRKEIASVAPEWQGDGLPTSSGSTTLHLEHLPAELRLAEHGGGLDVESEWTITDIQQRGRGPRNMYAVVSPVRVAKTARRFAPKGMQVFADGTELKFTAGGLAATGSWRFEQNRIVMNLASKPEQIRVVHPDSARGDRRLSWDASKAGGMTPEAFVDYGTTQGDQSYEGMLLPTGSSATWTSQTLPEGATFKAHVSIVPGAGRAQADAILEVLSDGEVVKTASRNAMTKSAYLSWEVDLSELSGQTVDVRLRTEAGGKGQDQDVPVLISGPRIQGNAAGDTRHVFVIGIDTMRPDHLSANGYHRDTSPELDAWAQDAVVFNNAWTSAPRTRPSFRAATTGRLPLEAVCAENIGSVFKRHGYATAGIVSNIHLNPRFDFDNGFDFWWLDGKAKADDQVDRAMDWLAEHEGEDTYMFLHIMDPHIFYNAPEPYGSKYTADLPLGTDDRLPPQFNRWEVYKWAANGQLTEQRKQHIEALYDGEVAYTSAQLGRFLAYVDELPGESVVVIHSDHGEEFWEHGGFEHNHTLYDDTTRALLWIKPPGGTGQENARSDYPATLQDIGPTLYNLAGLTDLPPVDGEDLTAAMRGLKEDDTSRAIPIAHLRYDADQWGVQYKGHKYILTTGTGKEELYDLTTDPGEQNNIAATTDTREWWQAMGRTHRVPTGQGWRILTDMPRGESFTLTLPAPAVAAGVIDPENIVKHPKNQVWGEKPPVTPDDVATVHLSEDGTTITVTGGKKGQGTLYVLFGENMPSMDALQITLPDGSTKDAKVGGKGGWRIDASGIDLDARPGVLVIPPMGEAERIKACKAGESVDEDESELELLKSLGYVGEEGAHNH